MVLTMKKQITLRNKLAAAGVSVFAGFFISSFIGSTASFVTTAVLLLCGAFMMFVIRIRAAAFVITALAAAFLMFGIYSSMYIDSVSVLYGSVRQVNAKILSVENTGNDNLRITAEGDAEGIFVRFSVYYKDLGFSAGDEIKAEIKFSEQQDPVSYNSNYNFAEGIFVRASVVDVETISAGSGMYIFSAIEAYREHIKDIVYSGISGDDLGLILAMFFGDKSELSPRLSENIRKCGLSHITAVSGMHFALIITILMSLLDLIGLRNRYKLRFFIAAVFIIVFMVFFDLTSSVRRSGIMMLFYYGSELFRRKSSSLNSLGAAMLVILLIEPCACRDPGLMLSACAAYGAGTAAPAVCRAIEKHIPVSERFGSLIASVCAAYFTIPLSAVMFGGFSLWSPITTLLVYPFFTAAMVITLALALTGGLIGTAAPVTAAVCVRPMRFIIDLFSGSRYGYITIDSEIILPFTAVSAAFISAVVIFARIRGKGIRPVIYSCVISFCALMGTVTADKIAKKDLTEIKIYSDGNDSLVAIVYPSGISLFATDVSDDLSSEAYGIMSGCGKDQADLLCVMAEQKHRAMYSDVFDGLKASEVRYLENTDAGYDIGGNYTVRIFEDAVLADINGVSLVICDVAAADIYGGQDIAIYSKYKKSAEYDINNVTILCDRRYPDTAGSRNAYYDKVSIFINKNGEYYVK